MVDSAIRSAAVPIAAPIAMGLTFGVYLSGLLTMVVFKHIQSSTFARSAWIGEKGVGIVVVFLTALYTCLDVRDLWFFATVMAYDLGPLLEGTASATVEPLVAGLIAMCVQITLVLRGSRIVTSPIGRALYLTFMALLILNAFIGATLATIWNVRFHLGGDSTGYLALDFPGCLQLWMWSTAGADTLITGTYILLLRRRLSNSNEIAASAMRLIITLAVRSAFPTALFAVISAILIQTVADGEAFYTNCIPCAFWLPLAQLHALSLFTTLGAAERVSATVGSGRELDELQKSSISGIHLTREVSVVVVGEDGPEEDGFASEGRSVGWQDPKQKEDGARGIR